MENKKVFCGITAGKAQFQQRGHLRNEISSNVGVGAGGHQSLFTTHFAFLLETKRKKLAFPLFRKE